jgi:general secretion pathway protein D
MRPTISRVTSFIKDPNPILAENDIESVVPQIQVREMESVLQVKSGQVAVLGGLIQDSVDLSDAGIPGTSQIQYVGDLFNFRNNKRKKSELVVFLRPRVITNLDKPVDVYADYLPTPGEIFEPGNASDMEAWN